MFIKINSFRNKKYNATAEYLNEKVIVLAGSRISKDVSHLLVPNGLAMKYRNDRDLVRNGVVLKNCEFNSLSTAAQFVTGTIVNGKIRWHLEDGRTVKDYFEDNK